MFGKKLLNLVSLLFISSGIVSVSGTACSSAGTGGSGYSDCGNGKYLLRANDCAGNECTAYDGTGNGYLYDCTDETNCSYTGSGHTAGYYLLDSNFKVVTDSTAGTVYKCTEAGVCTLVGTTPGYYLEYSGKYIKCDSTLSCTLENAPVTTTNDCSASYVGKICYSTGVKFAVADGIYVNFSEDKDYLVVDTGTVFTGSNSNSVAVKSADNAVILDTALTTTYLYCLEDTTNVLWKRDAALCSATNNCETNYYTCAATGICSVESTNPAPRAAETCDLAAVSAVNCAKGYYITVHDGKTLTTNTALENADLYYCDTATTCNNISSTNIPLGYLRNNGDSTGDYPFIHCYISSGTRVCKPYQVSRTSCDAANEIYKTGSGPITYSLCLETTTSKGFDIYTTPSTYASAATDYVISIESSIYGLTAAANHFIVLRLDNAGNVKVVQGGNRFIYTNKADATNKYMVYVRGSLGTGANDICYTGYANIQEYAKNEWHTDGDAYNTDATTNADYYIANYNN